jgi:hypothetical protein
MAAVAAVAVLLAGCSTTGSPSSGDNTSTDVVYQSADGSCAAEPRDGVDFATADAFIAEFEETATSLPVTTPLPEPIDPATTVVYLNNGTAVNVAIEASLTSAAAAAGVELKSVATGIDAQSINAAVGTVAQNPPDILIAAAVGATFFQSQIETLEAGGTTIVYVGNSDAEQYGLLDSQSGYGASLVNGQVLGAAAIALTCGTATDFVFYNIPELSFSDVQRTAAEEYLAENCSECTLRVVNIPITTMSTTAGAAIISDLQAHPETQFFITPADQMQIGLQAKMEIAGIDIPGIGQSSLPPNLEQIAAGVQLAGYAVDYYEYSWLALDEGLRRHQGVEVSYGDWTDWLKSISRVITQVSAGQYEDGIFVAYPEMENDFATLWGKD